MNHFPNHVELTRKDLMAKHLKRAVRAAQKAGRTADVEALGFFPATFVLPAEGALLLDAFRAEGGVWIFKPVRMTWAEHDHVGDVNCLPYSRSALSSAA